MHHAAATWTEVAARRARGAPLTLLVPVGSCEQHGPHLPLDTDTRIAVAVAERVAGSVPDVVVGPPVAYGSSGEHQDFDGTLSIGGAALRQLLIELGRSAFPATGGPYGSMWFVNGHGGNTASLIGATRTLVDEGRPARWWAPRLDGGDAHAGRTETSLLLAIAPDAVGADRPVGCTAPLEELAGELRRGGIAAVSDNGVLGDARGASADEGRALLGHLVDDLSAALTGAT